MTTSNPATTDLRTGRSRRRLLIAVATTFLAGFTARALLFPATDRLAPVAEPFRTAETAGAAAAPNTGLLPVHGPFGMPAGFARDGAGARTAAAQYVLASSILFELTDEDVPTAMSFISAGATAVSQTQEALRQVMALRTAIDNRGGTARFWQAVLGTRLESLSVDGAVVMVWSVGVLTSVGVIDPQSSWSTNVVQLVWERGDWKLLDQAVTPGPTPIADRSAPPTLGAPFEHAIAGFLPWWAQS
ncbi:MAG: hypothetical protein AB7G23_21220 [Vicinamibacterales bacterium]